MANDSSSRLKKPRKAPYFWYAYGLKFLHASIKFVTWDRINAAIDAAARNTTKLLWISACIIIVIFVLRDLSEELVTIEPISVPKALSENGYTPEVASRRLRDVLSDYALKANSSMKSPTISPRDELPNIVVPKIDISLDTIISSIRTLLHSGNRRNISGEFIIRDKLAWLRLRVDGREVYTSPIGFDAERYDELLAAAAPAVMELIRPYLVASTLFNTDPMKANQKADEIIATLPESDINVQWAYVLKAIFYIGQNNYGEAGKVLRRALQLNESNASAHNNYGLILFREGKFDEAIGEFKRVIKIDPKFESAHTKIANVLKKQRKFDDAIAEFKRVIESDPKNVFAHVQLGIVLQEQGKLDEAIAEFKRAIEIDPKDVDAHVNFGDFLRKQGKLDEAIAEFKRAIEINPSSAYAHHQLGFSLREQGKLDEAIAEFKRAIEIDPKDVSAHDLLGLTLKEKP